MSAGEVDGLSVADFAAYIDGIDAYIAEMNKSH